MSSLDNNIAIIRLKKPLELSQYTQVACIPDVSDRVNQSQYLAVNTSGVTTGYDMFRNDKGIANQWVNDFNLNILNMSYCDDIISKYTLYKESLFCAGLCVSLFTLTQISYN